MKRLIVNADDLGRSRGVNAGVERSHRDGIVTAATVMVTGDAVADVAALAHRAPGLDLGVHLTLTYGRPVLAPGLVRSLVEPSGVFPRDPAALLRTGRADRDEALAEYRAQWSRAERLLGRPPSHLDTHHWLHDEPALEWAIGALARETGAAVRPHDDGQRDRFRAAGIRTVDAYRRDFQHAGHVDVATLQGIFASLPDGVTELGCHPGEPDPELERTSAYAALRVVELATLTDPRIRAALARHGIELATYAAVG